MADIDLQSALQMFQQGMQRAATTSAVSDATQAMHEINSTVTDEAQKRIQLQQLGNDLALNLVGIGTPAAHVEQAFKAISPQNFGSAEQMQLEGALSGNQQYQQQAAKIIQQRQALKQGELSFENKLQQNLIDRKFQNDLAIEQLKLAKTNPEIKPEELQFQTNINVAGNLLKDLRSTVEEFGTYENALVGNPSAAAKLDAIPYQVAITYAKIVDPASVAREGEVAAAQKYMIDLGATSNKKKTLAQLDHMEATINDYAKQRLSTQKRTGSSTAKKLDAKSPIQSSGTIEVRQLKDGTRVKVMRTSDGKYLKVD